MYDSPILQKDHIVDVVQRVTSQVPGRTVFDLGPILAPEQCGFTVTTGTGLALVFADVTDAYPDEWSMQFVASIASDVPLFDEVARWVNGANRDVLHGKYYYAVARDGGLCAINWEVSLPSRIMNSLFKDSSKPVLSFVEAVINTMVEHATYTSVKFTKDHGGRLLLPVDAMQLLVTSQRG